MSPTHCPICCHFSPAIPLTHSNIQSAPDNCLKANVRLKSCDGREKNAARKVQFHNFASTVADCAVNLIHTRRAEGTDIIYIVFQCGCHFGSRLFSARFYSLAITQNGIYFNVIRSSAARVKSNAHSFPCVGLTKQMKSNNRI